jgi:hypothetical protein
MSILKEKVDLLTKDNIDINSRLSKTLKDLNQIHSNIKTIRLEYDILKNYISEKSDEGCLKAREILNKSKW